MNYKIKRLIKAFISIFVTKKILIGIIIALLMILLGSKVFAFSFEENGQTVTLPDFPYGDNFYVGHAVSNNTNLYFIWSLNNDNSFFYNGNSLYTFASASASSYGLDTSTNTWIFGETRNGGSLGARSQIVASTVPIYTNVNKTDIWFQPNIQIISIPPYIMNTETDLTGLLSPTITIDTGSYSLTDFDDFNFMVSMRQLGSEYSSFVYITNLEDPESPFYYSGGVNGEYFEIPVSVFKDSLIDGYEVSYILQYWLDGASSYTYDYIDTIYTPDLQNMTDTEQIQNTIKQNTALINSSLSKLEAAQKENTEVQRGIFGQIGQVLSYINPLSDNFFAYKLLDLLVDALIDLFVPSSDFFASWFADLNDYFSARFGMLYYPFELVINILNRVINLSNNLTDDFIINTPAISLMGVTIIPSTSYDFADLLENETFATVYNIYLTCVDVILVCCLVVLLKNTFVEIFGGRFADELADTYNSESDYARVARYNIYRRQMRLVNNRNDKNYKNS